MRFMLLVKADRSSEAGAMPSARLLAEMGARVRFSGTTRTVIDGPFPNPHELIAGFWLIQVASKADAIEWVKRCPNPSEGEPETEIRQVLEADDFGPALTPELREAEARLRAQTTRPTAATPPT